jgi:hypothetical protein
MQRHDSKSWRARAEECRSIAQVFRNPETRARMLRVAADYDRLAETMERDVAEPAGRGSVAE